MSTTTIGARVPEELKQRLQAVCDQSHKNISDGLVEAIEHYIERKEHRLELRRMATVAHENYVLTGRSHTHAKVGEWLETLAQGNRELPK